MDDGRHQWSDAVDQRDDTIRPLLESILNHGHQTRGFRHGDLHAPCTEVNSAWDPFRSVGAFGRIPGGLHRPLPFRRVGQGHAHVEVRPVVGFLNSKGKRRPVHAPGPGSRVAAFEGGSVDAKCFDAGFGRMHREVVGWPGEEFVGVAVNHPERQGGGMPLCGVQARCGQGVEVALEGLAVDERDGIGCAIALNPVHAEQLHGQVVLFGAVKQQHAVGITHADIRLDSDTLPMFKDTDLRCNVVHPRKVGLVKHHGDCWNPGGCCGPCHRQTVRCSTAQTRACGGKVHAATGVDDHAVDCVCGVDHHRIIPRHNEVRGVGEHVPVKGEFDVQTRPVHPAGIGVLEGALCCVEVRHRQHEIMTEHRTVGAVMTDAGALHHHARERRVLGGTGRGAGPLNENMQVTGERGVAGHFQGQGVVGPRTGGVHAVGQPNVVVAVEGFT